MTYSCWTSDRVAQASGRWTYRSTAIEPKACSLCCYKGEATLFLDWSISRYYDVLWRRDDSVPIKARFHGDEIPRRFGCRPEDFEGETITINKEDLIQRLVDTKWFGPTPIFQNRLFEFEFFRIWGYYPGNPNYFELLRNVVDGLQTWFRVFIAVQIWRLGIQRVQ